MECENKSRKFFVMKRRNLFTVLNFKLCYFFNQITNVVLSNQI